MTENDLQESRAEIVERNGALFEITRLEAGCGFLVLRLVGGKPHCSCGNSHYFLVLATDELATRI